MISLCDELTDTKLADMPDRKWGLGNCSKCDFQKFTDCKLTSLQVVSCLVYE